MEVNELGRCPLHPSMQLQSRKKNGEWRVLMERCPLCVSGLPSELQEENCNDEARGNEQENSSRTPVKNRSEQQQQRQVLTKTGPSQQPNSIELTKVNSYDSGETTEDDVSSVMSSPTNTYNMHQEFHNFLKADQRKMMASSASPNKLGSPGGSKSGNNQYTNGGYSSPKPRPNSPLSYSPMHKGGQQQSPYQIMKQRLPPPPHGVHRHPNGSSQKAKILSPDPTRVQMKRPDPESIGDQGPFFYHPQQGNIGRGTPKNVHGTPQRHPQMQRPQHQSPYTAMDGYGTPKQTLDPEKEVASRYKVTPRGSEQDDASTNSTSRYYTPKAMEPDQITDDNHAASMDSLKRNLYKSSTHTQNPPQSPFTPQDDESYSNHHPSLYYSTTTTSSSSSLPNTTHKPLEQDEVSAVSMNSVTRQLYTSKSNESSEGNNASVSSNDKKEILSTAECDAKGKCIRHPTVRLRKKKLFGGWQVVLSDCPECCLDEMRRVKDERSKSGKSKSSGSRCGSEVESKGGKSSGSKANSTDKAFKKKKKKDKKRRERMDPPMSQVNIASSGEDDKSIGTASTITISSYTHASSGGKHPKNWQDFTSNEEAGSACVTRMPYTDCNGERGWYTGAVDGTTGIPHGFGTMNYSDGAVYEGQWLNGKSVIQESQMINSPAKARYPPQGGHGGRRMHPPPPRSPLETHYEDDSRSNTSRTRSRSLSRSRAIMRPQQQPNPMIQQQRKVVCGMLWTDSRGSGSYTGEVNGLNIPEGVGSMRYDLGSVMEGLWRDGEIEEDANEEDDVMSYQGDGQLDGFLRRNHVGARENGGSASVM